MFRRSFVYILSASLVFSVTASAPGAATDEQVLAEIKKITNQLIKLQDKRGTWENTNHAEGRNSGGVTALVTYALLTAGVSYQDARLKRAIKYLQEKELTGTYAVACRSHVWGALPSRFAAEHRKDMQWLTKAAHPTEGGGYGFHYTYEAKTWDNSCTQYGVLGLWEASKRGLPVPASFWSQAEKHFLATQLPNGGWNYSAKHGAASKGTMNAAGLTCLYITRDYVHAGDFRRVGVTPNHPVQKAIEKGLVQLAKQPSLTMGGYGMYGHERVGLASGLKYIGGRNWFADQAAKLVKGGARSDPANLSFELLFLVRGRVPVFINKLMVPDFHWNNRPSAIAKLTKWVSDEIEQEMIWQVVPLAKNPEDWLDAPILFISGHEALALTEAQEKKIKRYIDLGGLLITTDEGSYKFTESIEAMLGKLYPQYKLQPLGEKDPVRNLVFNVKPGRMKTQSLHNGVRHLALVIPTDIAWTLHAGNFADTGPWGLLTNAYYYATEKGQARPRLAQHYLSKTGGGGPSMTVGRARYAGNWNPEPLAWEIQGNFMANAGKATVQTKNVGLSKLDGSGMKFVHVAGNTAIEFSQAEIDSVRKFVEGGGTIFFENVGGRGDFDQSVMEMLSKAFGRKRVRPVNLGSNLVTGKGFGGYDISKVDYRPFALLRMGQIEVPRLMTM
ncbi:MAG: DUF4159 domain-containing protein, partial [Phycisphaerae bacterium]|nr:DUF4159 domain-containing protein [Phycisphaerae bacterium]